MSRCIYFDWPNEEGRTDYEALWQEEVDFCKGDRFAELLSFLFERSDIFSLRYANFNGASVFSSRFFWALNFLGAIFHIRSTFSA